MFFIRPLQLIDCNRDILCGGYANGDKQESFLEIMFVMTSAKSV